jgi:pyridinium-3,5-bisthiocarboxylic acid mononucleotide nickel chelatase
MARVLYLDCFSGVAGDMLLAALIDAGLPVEALRQALGSLGVGHDIEVTRVVRAGIGATHFKVRDSRQHDDHDHHHHHHDADHDHDHHHHHHQGHGHHTLAEINALIERSSLSASGKARAIELFGRIGEAEAAIHETTLDQVHLHEVGALDSIIDIVGAVFALEWFGVDDIVSSPLNVGSGTIQIAHGTFPVPAPATLRLLKGVPVYSSGLSSELVTPTGALLISAYARSYGPLPPMSMDRVGYGAGTKDFDGVPNVLRVVLGERMATPADPPLSGGIAEVVCEIDDMNPQLFGPVSDRLINAGALDVFLTAVQMKKGRPGTLLTVLTPDTLRTTITEILFRETTTIGVRFHHVERETLDRRWQDVRVEGRVIRIKVAERDGAVLNAAPEFDDCLRVAEASGQPVKIVQAAAMRAWLDLNSK